MPWEIKLSEKDKIIELVYEGNVSPQELNLAFRKIACQIGVQGYWRCLADCRKLDGGHSVTDLYTLVQQISKKDLLRKFKEAVVLNTDQALFTLGEFYENASQNRGIKVRVFDNIKDARRWLLES